MARVPQELELARERGYEAGLFNFRQRGYWTLNPYPLGYTEWYQWRAGFREGWWVAGGEGEPPDLYIGRSDVAE